MLLLPTILILTALLASAVGWVQLGQKMGSDCGNLVISERRARLGTGVEDFSFSPSGRREVQV